MKIRIHQKYRQYLLQISLIMILVILSFFQKKPEPDSRRGVNDAKAQLEIRTDVKKDDKLVIPVENEKDESEDPETDEGG